MQAQDKQAVSDAANEIDRLLRDHALTVGGEFGDLRRVIVEPLEVLYQVDPGDRMVRVISVRLVT